MREVADTQVHDTTGEPPIAQFERPERQALRPLLGRLAKDVEATIASAEGFFYAASAILLLRQLAR